MATSSRYLNKPSETFVDIGILMKPTYANYIKQMVYYLKDSLHANNYGFLCKLYECLNKYDMLPVFNNDYSSIDAPAILEPFIKVEPVVHAGNAMDVDPIDGAIQAELSDGTIQAELSESAIEAVTAGLVRVHQASMNADGISPREKRVVNSRRSVFLAQKKANALEILKDYTGDKVKLTANDIELVTIMSKLSLQASIEEIENIRNSLAENGSDAQVAYIGNNANASTPSVTLCDLGKAKCRSKIGINLVQNLEYLAWVASFEVAMRKLYPRCKKLHLRLVPIADANVEHSTITCQSVEKLVSTVRAQMKNRSVTMSIKKLLIDDLGENMEDYVFYKMLGAARVYVILALLGQCRFDWIICQKLAKSKLIGNIERVLSKPELHRYVGNNNNLNFNFQDLGIKDLYEWARICDMVCFNSKPVFVALLRENPKVAELMDQFVKSLLVQR